MENDLVWQAIVTKEMVSELSADQIEMLIEDLSDSVMITCQEYGLEN